MAATLFEINKVLKLESVAFKENTTNRPVNTNTATTTADRTDCTQEEFDSLKDMLAKDDGVSNRLADVAGGRGRFAAEALLCIKSHYQAKAALEAIQPGSLSPADAASCIEYTTEYLLGRHEISIKDRMIVAICAETLANSTEINLACPTNSQEVKTSLCQKKIRNPNGCRDAYNIGVLEQHANKSKVRAGEHSFITAYDLQCEDPEYGAKAAKKLAQMYSQERAWFGHPISLSALFRVGVSCMQEDPGQHRDYEFLEMAAENREPTAALWYGKYLIDEQQDIEKGTKFLQIAISESAPEIAGEAAFVIAQIYEREGLQNPDRNSEANLRFSLEHYKIAAGFGYSAAISKLREMNLYEVSIRQKKLSKNILTKEWHEPERIQAEVERLRALSDNADGEVAGAASLALADYYPTSGIETQTIFFGLITLFDVNAEREKFIQKHVDRTGRATPSRYNSSAASNVTDDEKSVVAQAQLKQVIRPQTGTSSRSKLEALHSKPNFAQFGGDDEL